ncbi:MAG: hypothetical protein QM734_11910 [Cyclobacteriaceae bacterium]
MLKYNLRNVALLLLVALAVFNACQKDNVSSKPTLLSFGPSTVKHGDTISFIGTNLNQITEIVMPVGIDIPKSSFIKQTSALIELVVPEKSMMGHVVLRYGKDSIVSKALFGAEYTITVRSYNLDTVNPGSNITITGNFLNYVKQVSFNVGQNVTQFVSQSLHELVVQVPLTAQTGPITLTDLVKTNPQVVGQDTLNNDLVLNVALPAVTGIAPSAGARQLNNFTLTGTNLNVVGEIDFKTTSGTVPVIASNFVSQSSTQIVVAVPSTAVTGSLTLVALSSLKSTTPSVTVIEPFVTSFSPSNESAQVNAGNTLTITGTDLDLVDSIQFPGVPQKIGVMSGSNSSGFTLTGTTEIDVTIPNGAMGGTMVFKTKTGMGIPVAAPYGPQLTLASAIFDDAIENGFGQWGGWGYGSSHIDYANTTQVRVGTKSIKVSYGGDWGGAPQMGGGPVSTSGLTYLAFSVYGENAGGSSVIQVSLNGGTTVSFSVVQGQWNDVKIALTDLGSPASVGQIWFQDKGWTGTVYYDQIGLK